MEIIPPWESPGSSQRRPTQTAKGANPSRYVAPVQNAQGVEHAGQLISIVINPAMALGTGHHETTAGCLEIIEDLLQPGDRVADIGCGSGILSIAAAKLGAASVLACDIDEESLAACRANAVLNRVAGVIEIVPALGADGKNSYESGRFDLVAANIIAETLIELRGPLTSCVKGGGHLLLSGIENHRLPLVEEAFIDGFWRLSRRRRLGDWSTIALHKQNDITDNSGRAGEGNIAAAATGATETSRSYKRLG